MVRRRSPQTLDAWCTDWARRFPSEFALRRATAAVAVILSPGEHAPELLFIRRPRRRGDRWSGDVAFPGGMARDGERAVDVARRETLEEVGLGLPEPIAALPRAWTVRPDRGRPMRVCPVVFRLDAALDVDALTLDPREVAEAFTVPLPTVLGRPRLRTRRVAGRRLPVPTIELGEGQLLWGLTLGMTRSLRRP